MSLYVFLLVGPAPKEDRHHSARPLPAIALPTSWTTQQRENFADTFERGSMERLTVARHEKSHTSTSGILRSVILLGTGAQELLRCFVSFDKSSKQCVGFPGARYVAFAN